jgi:hypothetical protein
MSFIMTLKQVELRSEEREGCTDLWDEAAPQLKVTCHTTSFFVAW